MNDKTWRILELLKWGEEWLGKKGIEQPRLNMEFLLGHVMEKKRVELYLAFEETVSQEKLVELKELLQRRITGEPLMYILGETEFHGLKIKVNPSAMIPRSETEAMMDEVLKEAAHLNPQKIADLGTGTGCLAILLAKHFPQAHVIAVDISEKALSLARENAERNQVSEKMHFLCEDILRWLEQNSGFDLIVANPPYISLEEFNNLPSSVKDHEPRTALTDEGDGTSFLKRILAGMTRVLNPQGAAFLEFGWQMGPWIADAAQENNLKAKIYKDIHGLDRFVKIQCP
ncbi:MAG: peptide chain release factor N(5)-glutamine methyltransferase [Candidatus Aureabacteria bacterium]|nr:peptide chain release factor N(5)-glutamine methyltransferase [Candidatus Auribacterota bacterium]